MVIDAFSTFNHVECVERRMERRMIPRSSFPMGGRDEARRQTQHQMYKMITTNMAFRHHDVCDGTSGVRNRPRGRMRARTL